MLKPRPLVWNDVTSGVSTGVKDVWYGASCGMKDVRYDVLCGITEPTIQDGYECLTASVLLGPTICHNSNPAPKGARLVRPTARPAGEARAGFMKHEERDMVRSPRLRAGSMSSLPAGGCGYGAV